MVGFAPTNVISQPSPIAARSKMWVYGCSLAGIAGSNTAGDIYVLSSVLSGRDLCDGPITRPEKSYRVLYV